MIRNNDKIRFFLKFVRPEYTENFKRGELYFSSLEYFIKEEMYDGIAKWGDKFEGTKFYKFDTDSSKFYFKLGTKNFNINLINKDVNSASISIPMSEKEIKYTGITCFTALSSEDFYSIGNNKFKLKISALQDIKKMQEGNRKIFLISNFGLLKHLFNLAKLKHRKVKYYDPNKDSQDLIYLESHHEEIPFYKVCQFEYQREYRVIKNIKNSPNVTFTALKSFQREVEIEDLENTIYTFRQLQFR